MQYFIFLRHLLLATAIITISACQHLRFNEENAKTFRQLATGLASCRTAGLFQVKMKHQRLYARQDNKCKKADLYGKDEKFYFTDKQCSVAVDYQPTRYKDFCREIIAPAHDIRGNAAVWAGKTQKWTLYPPSRFNVGILSSRKNQHPFMKRALYKETPARTITTVIENGKEKKVTAMRGQGTCYLEMRIFKKKIDGINLKPLLLIHGGAWRSRSPDYLALETQVSHYTERGFVVFAPFYRLVADLDANIECNGASWQQVVSDAESAFDWVKTEGPQYGASNEKLRVMGHSAGGHLTTWLAIHRANDIEKVMINYGPTDFRFYVDEIQKSDVPLKGERFIQGYLGRDDLKTINLDNEDITANTFTEIITKNPDNYPPMFIIHGRSDTLVPSSQSVRLCNALSGDIKNGPAKNDGGNKTDKSYRKIYQCNEKSQLHLIREANHGLDICLHTKIACPTGNKKSQKATRRTLAEAANWISQ